MAFDDKPTEDLSQGGGNDFKRQMFQGDWVCSKCGAKISELPFKPDPGRVDALLCRDCYRDRRRSFGRV